MNVETHRADDGFERVVCSNDDVELVLIPELGAKIVSLLDRASGREWIAPPAQPYRRARVGDAFEDFDRGGWDECFPNVGAGPYPGADVELADHGEVWSQPWALDLAGGSVTTRVTGQRLPFALERTIALAGTTVELRYSAENTGAEPLCCLWSMHPLFAAIPGTRILVPGVDTVYCDDAHDSDAFGGYLARCDWPLARTVSGSVEDLSRFGTRDNFAVKVYSERLERGVVALVDEETTWLGLAFDPMSCPYVGVWINEGVWPSDAPLHHVALEPTSGRADKLDVASEVGDTWLVAPGARQEWTVEVRLGSGDETLAAFLDGSA